MHTSARICAVNLEWHIQYFEFNIQYLVLILTSTSANINCLHLLF